MIVSPLAPALWIVGVFSLLAQLVDFVVGSGVMDPLITIIFYLLSQELSKFVAEMTMREDDGNDSN